MPFGDLPLPASIALGALAAAAYALGAARWRQQDFGWLDAMIMASLMAIVSALALPFLREADEKAKLSVLVQNLHTLRGQIERYRIEHGGNPPLIYRGSFPQLTRSTNGAGVPGLAGKGFPYGPYLPEGVPANPFTGVAWVEPIATFPPQKTHGIGGWLYYPPTGQIAPDLAGHLSK